MTLRPRFPPRLFLGLTRALVSGTVRSLAADAATLERALPGRPEVEGIEHVPLEGPLVLVANHYQRPGLWIGWAGAAITCAVARRRGGDPPVRWTVVEDWRVGAWALPGSSSIFRGIARAWSMVPMPTASGSVRGRAAALRRLEVLARDRGVVGIFPEGSAGRAGVPGEALAGVGRWLRRQAEAGVPVVPVAIAERDGTLALRFGPALSPHDAADPMPHLRRLHAAIVACDRAAATAHRDTSADRGRPHVGGSARGPASTGRSHLRRGVGRWGRAAALLHPDEYLVVDAGCAFGFGTIGLTSRHRAVGVERDSGYVDLARRRYPTLPLVRGDVSALPLRSGTVDAVLLLDVLEHLADPACAIAEAHRVLRPGGALIVSVPRRGALVKVDSLNTYARLARPRSWPSLDPTEASAPEHRHFGERELASLLRGFHVERVERTAFGLAELPHLALLVLLRGVLRWEAAYRALRFCAFGLSILEDAIPAGPLAYNLYVRAVKRDPDP